MSDTDSNAYRVEADQKRVQANVLNEEADNLDTKADELEGKTPAPATDLPAGGETYDPSTEQPTSANEPDGEPEKSGKLFGKK